MTRDKSYWQKGWIDALIWTYALFSAGVHFLLGVTKVWIRPRSQESVYVKYLGPSSMRAQEKGRDTFPDLIWEQYHHENFFQDLRGRRAVLLLSHWLLFIWLVGWFCSVYVVLLSFLMVCVFLFYGHYKSRINPVYFSFVYFFGCL